MSNTSNGNLVSKEDLISMFLGLAIVGIVMIVLVNYFKSRSGRIDLGGIVDVNDEQVSENDISGDNDVMFGDYVVETGGKDVEEVFGEVCRFVRK